MNFFEHQHQARRSTHLLVFLFAVAVICIVAAVTALVTVFVMAEGSSSDMPADQEMFYTVAMYTAPLVLMVIAMVSAFRISSLSGEGRKVAEFMGATPLESDPTDFNDRQLRNVVEEMAIASGVPVPEIFVMRDELGINAFAAGTVPSQAAVGITQGALDNLTRDELQGVIAHEFSHIFNGDMKLNVNLMGLLGGIMFLHSAGRGLLEVAARGSRSRSRKGDPTAALFFLGLGLLIIGAIGTFFARWIKAAVSRQREFLADASAVQYTRNPDGLGGALVRIRDSHSAVNSAGAEEASHMFFGSIKSFLVFATHPPIDERIARLGQVQIDPKRGMKTTATSAEAKARVGKPRPEDLLIAAAMLNGISGGTREVLNKPKTAMELVIGLIAKESGNRAVLSKLSPEVLKIVEAQSREQYLALFDLAVPALRRLEPMMAANFLQTIEVLIKEDGKIQPLEIAVLSILRRLFEARVHRRRETLAAVSNQAADLLRCLAVAGHPGDQVLAREAFDSGGAYIGLTPGELHRAWTQSGNGLELEKGLIRLSALDPREKAILFEAVWRTVNHDKKLTADEAQYLRAVSEALEIPLPPTAAHG